MDDMLTIKKAAAGNTDAFEELARKYQDKIYYLALRILKNEQDAFDAAQEALIKIYLSLGRFSFRSEFSTWIYSVTKNACLDFIRKNRKHEAIPIDEVPAAKEVQNSDGEAEYDPQRCLEIKESNRVLAAAVMALGEDQRRIWLLREIDGYSYDEIAALLAIPPGTVKSRLARARAFLAKTLEKTYDLEQGFFAERNM